MDPYGRPLAVLVEACNVSPDTVRRWKRLGRIPPVPARLLELVLEGELGALSAPWAGFKLSGKNIFTPDGFSVAPGEICAIPYRAAQIRALELELATPQQRELFR